MYMTTMMTTSRGFRLVVALALCCILTSFTSPAHGFIPTRKKSAERRTAFSKQAPTNENGDHHHEDNNNNPSDAAAASQYEQSSSSSSAVFAIPPNAMGAAHAHAAALYEYEEEDEEEVSYEVALVSCIVSLAIGFGTGYLV